MARVLGIVISSLVCSACGAIGLSTYSRPGVTDQQKSTDYYECRRDSSVLRDRGKGMQEYVPDPNGLNACMRARGYEVPRVGG
jgi:hypothetical protein